MCHRCSLRWCRLSLRDCLLPLRKVRPALSAKLLPGLWWLHWLLLHRRGSLLSHLLPLYPLLLEVRPTPPPFLC